MTKALKQEDFGDNLQRVYIKMWSEHASGSQWRWWFFSVVYTVFNEVQENCAASVQFNFLLSINFIGNTMYDYEI
jgi:hypothetical protein